MNIKDFLIDNYIWIIVIILITIITIIGFLADKKKGEKKNKVIQQNQPNMNGTPMMNNAGPMQYQPQVNQMNNNNNMGMNFNNNLNNNAMGQMNQTGNIQNQNLGNMNQMQTESQIVSTVPTGVNQINNPQPVENIIPTQPQEPIYQPLSEQKPVIAPQPIPNFNNNQNNQDMMQVTDNMQSGPNMMTTQNQMNSEPSVIIPLQTIQQPTLPEQNMMQPQTFNNQVTMPQTNENNNFGPIPNFNQNNITIPQSVNPIPTPQPVNPQPIIQQPMINNQPIGQTNFEQQMPTSEQMNQPMQQPTVNQPISFVYGPQNNNQNM